MHNNGRIFVETASEHEEEIRLTEDVVKAYHLDDWAREFSLMTAGYRNRLDPDDPWNPEAPFNLLTVSVMVQAKANVFQRATNGAAAHVHLGGEVRPHTAKFIEIAARIYAANGFTVHLRADVNTTPIWYSSFGVFYEGFQSGDNFTASHSAYYKGGWKPIDEEGKQLSSLEKDIVDEVRNIVAARLPIRLAPWRSGGRILHDFNIDKAYSGYQETVLGGKMLATLKEAGRNGFSCYACPLGGSMGATSRRIFHELGIPVNENGIVKYMLDTEDNRFHRVGEIDGQNHGADPSKREIYRNIGAQEKLLNRETNLVMLWDPDGDRFNIVTAAPLEWGSRASDLGLEIEEFQDSDQCVVYFTPNQLYFLLTDYRIRLLKETGLLDAYDWVIITSFPTSLAFEELAGTEHVPVARVGVGFKHLGDLCRILETSGSQPVDLVSVTGKKVSIGPNPRAIILCEESGGACLGGTEFLESRNGTRSMLALREKDGLQMSLLTMAFAAFLFNSEKSVAQHYCELIESKNIQYRFCNRQDVRLYDEGLIGDELQQAKTKGIHLRDNTMKFFRDISEKYNKGNLTLDGIRNTILARSTHAWNDCPEIIGYQWIEGNGPLIQLDGIRIIIRASGTDAVLRMYVDSTSRQFMEQTQQLLKGLIRE